MRSIRGYSTLATPLTALAKKQAFQWTETTSQAFVNLKQALTSPPVLALPNFTLPFVIKCDALASRIGAVLMQNYHPIVWNTRVQRGLHQLMREREMLGILLAIKEWRQYLLSKEFIIKTDHKPLKYLLEQRLDIEA